MREVEEETGARGRLDRKLGDVRYVYTWDGRAHLQGRQLLPRSATRAGGSATIRPEFAHEVAEVRWLPLADAPRLLAYGGEREMAARALDALGAL